MCIVDTGFRRDPQQSWVFPSISQGDHNPLARCSERTLKNAHQHARCTIVSFLPPKTAARPGGATSRRCCKFYTYEHKQSKRAHTLFHSHLIDTCTHTCTRKHEYTHIRAHRRTYTHKNNISALRRRYPCQVQSVRLLSQGTLARN